MKYNFDEIAILRGTNSSRFLALKENELNLTIADMDFKILPEIEAILQERIAIGAYPYSEVPEHFFKSFISYQKARHNNNLFREQLLFSTSVIASLDSLLDVFLKKNDKMVMFTPIYNTFYSCLKNHELEILSCPFKEIKNEYQIDFGYLEKLFEENEIKLFLLCNPHNPAGKIFSKDEIDKIVSLCKEKNILLVSDEIHSDITDLNKEYYSLIHYFKDYKNIIVLNSASKAFNLAGMHSSIVIVDDKDIRDRLSSQLYKNDVGEPNFFGPYASLAAWSSGLEYNYQLREYIEENKKYLLSLSLEKKYSMKLIDGGATYLLWFKVPSQFKDGDEFASLFYLEEGIKVSPGSLYGGEGKNFIRVNIATNRENIKTFASRLIHFLDKRI